MPLINFGSILGFAEELETNDQIFYSAAANNPGCGEHKELFEQFVIDCKKSIKNIRRTKRENVTEMILEGISDFTRAPFVLEHEAADNLDVNAVMEIAKKLEERAERYYLEAADKMKALSEVARELKLVAKKRTAHRTKLEV